MQSKTIFVSKTFWVNILTVALAIISMTQPDMLGVKPEQLLWISGVINIVLRFISSGAVSLTGSTATEVK